MKNIDVYNEFCELQTMTRQTAAAVNDYGSILNVTTSVESSEHTAESIKITTAMFASICERLQVPAPVKLSLEGLSDGALADTAQVSLEFMIDAAKKIWKKIVEILVKFKDWLISFFKTTNVNNTVLNARQEKIRNVVKDLEKEDPVAVKEAAQPDKPLEFIFVNRVVVRRKTRYRQEGVDVAVKGPYMDLFFTEKDYSLKNFMRRITNIDPLMKSMSAAVHGIAKVITDLDPDRMTLDLGRMSWIDNSFLASIPKTRISESVPSDPKNLHNGVWYLLGVDQDSFPGSRIIADFASHSNEPKIPVDSLKDVKFDSYLDVFGNKLNLQFVAPAIEPAMVPEVTRAIDSILENLRAWKNIGDDITNELQNRIKYVKSVIDKTSESDTEMVQKYTDVFVVLNVLYGIASSACYKSVTTMQKLAGGAQSYLVDSIKAYH